MLDLNNPKTKFVVAGGGSAGWLTALFVKKHYPNISVTVIESKDIGILGAGEGTTPHFVTMLDELGIPSSEILKHANGTIKNGIKFTNWNDDKEHYYHNFATFGNLDYDNTTIINYSDTAMIVAEEIANNRSLNNVDFASLANERGLVKFIAKNNITIPPPNPILYFNGLGKFALHFNAHKLADFLKTVGVSRGINVVEGIISKINTDKEGYITSFKLENNRTVKCDFVFDCTGFQRLIIGKHYNSEWKSYKEYLPVNRALPFFRKIDDNIPPYTESIAMQYGWVWKIPLQDRYGCGYVFDSNLISDEDAKKEINEMCGEQVDIPRSFSFEAGVYKQQWVKNCIATGLASGFVEPLEATSIWVTINTLRKFLVHIKGVTYKNETHIKLFNNTVNKMTDDILTFVHFHYLTKRVDTLFWKDFTKNNKTPGLIQRLIENDKDLMILANDGLLDNVFPFFIYLQVGAGIKYFNQEEAKKTFESLNTGLRQNVYKTAKEFYLRDVNLALTSLPKHKDFINFLITNQNASDKH